MRTATSPCACPTNPCRREPNWAEPFSRFRGAILEPPWCKRIRLRIQVVEFDSHNDWHAACTFQPSVPTHEPAMTAADNVLETIQSENVEFVDLRFADMRGVEHHVTFPAHAIDADTFEDGKMFDGSSIAGWKGINESDMILMPDPSTAFIDPFAAN